MTDDQRTLLHGVIVRYTPGMLSLINERDFPSWDEEQRITVVQTIAGAYTGKRNQGMLERREFNDIELLLGELSSHVYADAPLHPDDFALFHEMMEKWNLPKLLLLVDLGKRPLRHEERTSLHNAITAELQVSGAEIGSYTNRLEGLIDYVSSQPSMWA